VTKRQVVILAGGLGTRLRPITEKVPKPLVPVGGKPYLHWQLLDLKNQGYRDVLLLVSYLGEQIEAEFGHSAYGLNISYSYEPEPLGTGGALKLASAQLRDEFVLVNGDSFLKAPFSKMELFFENGNHSGSSFSAVMSTYDNRVPVPVIPNLKTLGALVVDYKKDAAPDEGFDKIDSGVYIMKKKLLDANKSDRFMLADLWPDLIAQGQLGAFAINERFWDIGTIDRLKEFEEKVRDYFPDTVSN
jgi:NDP-sugar pyrophosphorylase family protein